MKSIPFSTSDILDTKISESIHLMLVQLNGSDRLIDLTADSGAINSHCSFRPSVNAFENHYKVRSRVSIKNTGFASTISDYSSPYRLPWTFLMDSKVG